MAKKNMVATMPVHARTLPFRANLFIYTTPAWKGCRPWRADEEVHRRGPHSAARFIARKNQAIDAMTLLL
jgi:hypothetical protein